MIKFFRRIRQNLLMENKTGKYFKYAVGEIILVVIGILIALQVNNINEQRKSTIFEVKVLKEIRNNLKTDLIEINEDLSLMVDINKATKDVKNHLLLLNKPTDSFSINTVLLRVTPHFSPINSGYNLLQSRGIGMVKNDSLRESISFHYDMLYPYYKTYEEERTRFHALHSEPKLLEYFSMFFDENEAISFRGLYFTISDDDYKKLKNDSTFFKLLNAIAFENRAIQSRGKRIKNSLEALIDKIEVELKSLE